MKKSTKIIIGVLVGIFVVIALTVLIFGLSMWNQRGEAVALKNQIEAQYLANQSDYDKMWKTFKEMAQVTELQAEQIKDVYTDLITGRYDGDENVAFKMITEDNPNIDSSVYKTLQNQIAADRAVFSNNQKKVLDIINSYNTYIEHEALIMSKILGFDKIDSSKYIVTSERTDNAFESGKDGTVDLKGE